MDEKKENKTKPKLEVDNDKSVLVEYGSGKKYHGQEAQAQDAQKGDTCWYYAQSKIRIRAGKVFDGLKSKYRDQEKAISEHRKLASELTAIKNTSEELLEGFKGLAKDGVMDKSFVGGVLLDTLKKGKISTGSTDFDNAIITCEAFLKSSSPSLTTFVKTVQDNDYYSKVLIRSSLGTLGKLKDLGVDIDTILKEELALRNITNLEKCSFTEQRIIYHNVIRHAAWDCFGFKGSNWNPKQGIDGLMDCLRNEGAMILLGRFGVPSYTEDPKDLKVSGLENIGSCNIIGWKLDKFKQGNTNLHEIVVVGAKKINEKEFVFFLDPHLPSKPGEERAVIMMSYDRLMKGIGNIYGQREIMNTTTNDSVIDNIKGPFALCADPEKMKVISSMLDESISQLTTESSLLPKVDTKDKVDVKKDVEEPSTTIKNQ